ncbi:hypothetical protein EBT16_01155 [bacterium]|nr:hypothetical protein [bacterium]
MDFLLESFSKITVFEWLLLSLLATDIWIQYLRWTEQKGQRRVLSFVSEETSANHDLLVRIAALLSNPNNKGKK